MVLGEPGIGKTLIAQALKEYVSSQPHAPLRHFCSPYDQNSVLYPDIAQLEWATRLGEHDAASVKDEANSNNFYHFNAPYLGPAIRAKRGHKLTVHVNNRIDEDITLHWHALIIPGPDDGGPYNVTPPGRRWTVQLSVDQPAATLWFHPHLYPATAELVIKGLAGLFIVEDEESAALGLPSCWGVDDIPVMLQDRRFNADGTFFHRFNKIAVAAGYVGDTMLVNGAVRPIATTARGWLRFRILDGSNARNFRLAISDGRSFFVVGSDGGLLSQPVEMKELAIAAGERYEVLVDARDGKAFDGSNAVGALTKASFMN